MWRGIFGVLAVLVAGAATAKDHLVEARAGAVERLLASGVVTGGDRILLGAGRHGDVWVRDLVFKPAVTMTAVGDRAILDSLQVLDSRGLVVSDLTILPATARPPNRALVNIERSRDVVLERLEIASAASADGWTAADWVARAHRGVLLTGRDITLRNSKISIVDHAVEALVDGALVVGNDISLFRGDGIRALGDRSRYVGNRIQGCVAVDDNHDDGFQSWSLGPDGTPGGGVVSDVVIADNVIRGGKRDGPLGCDLQGIGMFDGIYENWVIKNNVIEVNHWHGITVMGARNVVVEGNVVVDETAGDIGPPWITITAHKDGRVSQRSVISDNVTQPRSPGGDPKMRQPQPGVVSRNNRVVATSAEAFR